MREVIDFPLFRTDILKKRTIHIFGLSFEERCLGYPTLVHQSKHAPSQMFRCLDPGEAKLSWPLKDKRNEHWHKLSEMFPNIHRTAVDAIVGEIEDYRPDFICIDVSALPRFWIASLVDKIGSKLSEARVFAIYSYPKTYAYGCLQEPAHDMLLYFKEALPRTKSVSAIILPGFDVEYSNAVLTFLKAATEHDPQLKWLFPFPGPKYHFYDRSLESHLEMLGVSNWDLLPQMHLTLAYERLRHEIVSMREKPIYLVPLGARITCIPVFAAILWARRHNHHADVILPSTRLYSSIRSEGWDNPSIEEVTGILQGLDLPRERV